mgnify:CR=1 FL=1
MIYKYFHVDVKNYLKKINNKEIDIFLPNLLIYTLFTISNASSPDTLTIPIPASESAVAIATIVSVFILLNLFHPASLKNETVPHFSSHFITIIIKLLK